MSGPSTIPGDQCDEPPMPLDAYAAQFPGAPAEIVAGWHDTLVAEWTAACLPYNPWAPPPGRYDDATLLGFLLSGHHVPEPQPTPIPLPPAGALYLAILVLAVILGSKRCRSAGMEDEMTMPTEDEAPPGWILLASGLALTWRIR